MCPPGSLAFAGLAIFAGGCASWSWYQGAIGQAVGAFVIGFFFALCARAADVEQTESKKEET